MTGAASAFATVDRHTTVSNDRIRARTETLEDAIVFFVDTLNR